MVKTRGYKWLIRLMPHTVDDLEPILEMLSIQDPNDRERWPTRYVLLLWLSIAIMVPFGLDCLTKPGKSPFIITIMEHAKKYALSDDVCQEAGAFLIAKFLSRPDVILKELDGVISWTISEISKCDFSSHIGQMKIAGCLRSIANICKIVNRNALVPQASNLLKNVVDLPKESVTPNVLIFRLQTKVIQRIGMLFCPPRASASSWRYQHGFRSLTDNLSARMSGNLEANIPCDTATATNVTDTSTITSLEPKKMNGDSEDIDVPEELADVIDHLINALHSKFTVVRWSAAKGLGRICSRLTEPFVDDVLTAILSLCSRLETFNAWHGACFALAELGRRCLLLPEKLPQVIPVVLRALVYDEKSGDCNFGSNVRDAACYCCWSFARAYRPSDFSPHVGATAQELILVALFDRELHVRRAAAAAFQENVGRQGQFSHGIEIITTCDYFAVGNLANCYLNLSEFVAKFPEYTQVIIDHLAFSRLGHWDENIRDLASRALNRLAEYSRDYIKLQVLPKLLEKTMGGDLYMRQGSVLGVAEIILALGCDKSYSDHILERIRDIISKLCAREYFRGVTGELMRRACCRLIQHISTTKLPFHEDPILSTWLSFLNECTVHREVKVQIASAPAHAAFLSTFLYSKDGKILEDFRDKTFDHLIGGLNARDESSQVGCLRVLCESPSILFMGAEGVSRALSSISTCSQVTPRTTSWGEARQKALLAFIRISARVYTDTSSITDEQFKGIYPTLLSSLSDYTVDSRGDIGSLVREKGMDCLFEFTKYLVTCGRFDLIQPDVIEEVFVNIAQQAVEKIDRTRGVAGRVFHQLLHHEPEVPHIPHADELRRIFDRNQCTNINWCAAHETFRLFVQLFDYPVFQYRLTLGFAVSIGGLTETTVRFSSESLRVHLLNHESNEEFVLNLMKTVSRIFSAFSKHTRLVIPLMRLLDFFLHDAVVAYILEEDLDVIKTLQNNVWLEVRYSKEIAKLKAGIDIFGAMLQFPDPIRNKALRFLAVMLMHKFPVMRKSAATKLYECMLMYDIVESDVISEVKSVLTETVWENDLDEIRPVCNRFCELMQLPLPKPKISSPVQ